MTTDSNILVVDDEPNCLASVRRGLMTSDFKKVRTECNPKKAAEYFKQGKSTILAHVLLKIFINGYRKR